MKHLPEDFSIFSWCLCFALDTKIDREYITNGLLDSENKVLALSFQEYAEMEEERMRKMPEKWPVKVAARIDNTQVLSKFFFVSEKSSESLFFIPE